MEVGDLSRWTIKRDCAVFDFPDGSGQWAGKGVTELFKSLAFAPRVPEAQHKSAVEAASGDGWYGD
jgi:hypothetical protein